MDHMYLCDDMYYLLFIEINKCIILHASFAYAGFEQSTPFKIS